MRRQYHSRQTERGLLVWDVHRLVELSRDLPVVEVDVEEMLDREASFWRAPDDAPLTPRDLALHARLIEETDLKYPIILCGEGRLMDGMHRLCKAWINEMATLRAVRFAETPEPDHVNVDPDTLPYDEPW